MNAAGARAGSDGLEPSPRNARPAWRLLKLGVCCGAPLLVLLLLGAGAGAAVLALLACPLGMFFMLRGMRDRGGGARDGDDASTGAGNRTER